MKDSGFGKKVPKEKLEEALKELNEAKEEAAKWKNEYYKAFADTQNLRKSLEEDHRTAVRYRAEGFVENLLPALDGFHMALETPAKSDEVKNYQTGFRYIYNQITKTLEDEGVKEIYPQVGENFNATNMHAVDTAESDGPEGKVVKVYAKGYMLYDRLIRPAMVSVSKKIEVKKDEDLNQNSQNEANKA